MCQLVCVYICVNWCVCIYMSLREKGKNSITVNLSCCQTLALFCFSVFCSDKLFLLNSGNYPPQQGSGGLPNGECRQLQQHKQLAMSDKKTARFEPFWSRIPTLQTVDRRWAALFSQFTVSISWQACQFYRK